MGSTGVFGPAAAEPLQVPKVKCGLSCDPRIPTRDSFSTGERVGLLAAKKVSGRDSNLFLFFLRSDLRLISITNGV